jgi:hypothetical protein
MRALRASFIVAVLVIPTASSALADAGNLKVAAGPFLVNADIDQEWGGHTFAYLLEGERCLFFSAIAYTPGGKSWTALVGQHPKPGSNDVGRMTPIPFTESSIHNVTQPLLLRSKDGYIHIFVGVSHSTANPGYAPAKLRYFRSAAPEDISQLVDRTALFPQDAPYNRFHLRMNVGVSRDGCHAALVVLAISPDGSVPFNTPVVFFGVRHGADFAFGKPIVYAEPMSLFYPQVAVTDAGTVVVGQVWDNPNRIKTRLLHIDPHGQVIHREDLPGETDGNYLCCDLRSAWGDDRSRLILSYNKWPKNGAKCRHEFWAYRPESKTLEQIRSIPVAADLANYGKWLPISDRRSVFINNPSMGTLHVWHGDLLGEGSVTHSPLTPTDPRLLGLAGTGYLFIPNPLQGSVGRAGGAWCGVDYILRRKDAQARGPDVFLLFQLSFQ